MYQFQMQMRTPLTRRLRHLRLKILKQMLVEIIISQQSFMFFIKILTVFFDRTAPASRKPKPHCINITSAPNINLNTCSTLSLASSQDWSSVLCDILKLTEVNEFDCVTISQNMLLVSARIQYKSDIVLATVLATRNIRTYENNLTVRIR